MAGEGWDEENFSVETDSSVVCETSRAFHVLLGRASIAMAPDFLAEKSEQPIGKETLRKNLLN